MIFKLESLRKGLLALAFVAVLPSNITPVHAADTVWVADALPGGASASGDEPWTWVSASPVPFSGTRAHQSQLKAGTHKHTFDNAASKLAIGKGDKLFAYVYLDPANPPRQVMLAWSNGGWAHRAYWGENLISAGTNGTKSRRSMGALPATGRWVRLEVPASLVALEGESIHGMAFMLYDGRATWDNAGKASPASTPQSGTAIQLPGTFQAENFDKGGPGVAYFDKTTGNAGGLYRTAEHVDIIASSDSLGGGYVVNNFETGEWLAYTVNVAAAGTYDIDLRVSSTFNTSAFHVKIDDVDVTGSVVVPSTGDWTTFQWVGKKGVTLPAGKHVLKIVADQQYFNLNSIRVTPTVDAVPPAVSLTSPAAGAAASGTMNVSANATDNIRVAGVQFKYNGTNIGAEVTAAPYTVAANTTAWPNGTHTLTAVARDAAGNVTTSAPVTITKGPVTPDTQAPSVPGGLAGVVQNGNQIRLTWNAATDNVGVTGYLVYLNDQELTSTTATTYTHTGLTTGTLYNYRVSAYDAVPNHSAWTATPVSITVPGSVPPPVPGTVLWSCDFPTAATNCGFWEQAKVAGRATVVTGGRTGGKAVRLHTEVGDNNVAGSGDHERNDLTLDQASTDCYAGRTQWWGHSIKFPDDYVQPPMSSASTWNFGIVFDFHNSTPGDGQANFQLNAMPATAISPDRPTGLSFQVAYGNQSNPTTQTTAVAPIAKNVWYDFVYNIKWSSGSDGYIDAWMNGTKYLTYRGPTLYAGQGCYLKLANYHTAFGQPSSVIHSRIVRGTTPGAVSLTPLQGVQF